MNANPQKIRLMTDYDCFPLWLLLPDGIRNISPDELPISDNLKRDILGWAARYDLTLRREDPALSGFVSIQEEEDFDNTGMGLWASLRYELGEGFDVVYFSQIKQCEVSE